MGGGLAEEVVLWLVLVVTGTAVADNMAVTTQHNNNARTGANRSETILTRTNINVENFGKVWSAPVGGAMGGRVSGQPLYLPNFAGLGGRNVVYVATSTNFVHAFDADDGTPLWTKNLGDPVPSPPPNDVPDLQYYCDSVKRKCNDQPYIGINSAPVIDVTTGAIYVVSRHWKSAVYSFQFHALSLVSGDEMFGGPKVLQVSAPGLGSQSYWVWLDPSLHIQRTALTLAHGYVYTGFGSWEDTQPFHGWVVGYPKDNLTASVAPRVYVVTPNDRGGGVWQAGAGLVVDSDGYLWAMTGNGHVGGEPGPSHPSHSQSFVKLDQYLNPVGTFLDPGHFCLNTWDMDLGSSGPVLLPGGVVAGAGKEGKMHVIRTTDAVRVQNIQVAGTDCLNSGH
jgi:hypothetical protein